MQLDIFEYQNEQEVRTAEINGEIWFVVKDVCNVLDIANYRNVLSKLDEDEKGVHLLDTPGGKQNLSVVNESGLYAIIIRSNKPEAKKFRKWVTSEILPQIRKTGAYAIRGSATPAFIKRFNDNWDRVDYGYFSVISELAIRVYGRLEQIGYKLPDRGKKGKEIRPDVSVGKLFAGWLDKNKPEQADAFKTYSHLLPDGVIVQARQYKIELLADFINYVDTIWMRERALGYFKERDEKALEYLPKLIPDLTSKKGRTTVLRKK